MYDVYRIREDFPVLREVVYLDSAATSQKPVQVAEAVQEYFTRYCGNYGRGAHRLSRRTTEKYEDARETVAGFFGINPRCTVFTRNTTESINMVALGLDWKKGDHVITTVVEHHSNLLPWIRLQEKGVEVTVVDSDMHGIVTAEAIEKAITDKTRLIAVTHVSNFFGAAQDIKAVARIAKKHGIMLLIDAAQSAGEIPLNLDEIGCDFAAMPGHKGLLGPQGTGILYVREPERLQPVFVGGGTVQKVTTGSFTFDEIPSRFEYGTPNIPGIIGLGRGVEYVKAMGVENIEAHVNRLARECARRLAEIPQVELYGPDNRVSLTSFNVENINPHDVAMILDETKKICVRSGQHCAQTALARLCIAGSVRASFACYSTMEEVDLLARSVEAIAKSFS
ncbi:cysteine desulfurase [Methanocella arvoryzae]|uniref:cysteine desulfurase n=1 Tax=Methanocella arvoryzae (strain DSM 22066 / NBRC 105507 / MRE50) TaxID=351160 RepID=Q0W2W6_METAR|nr:cysteine desulfurase [Methanocella arvoryzae]CAJ37277.1 putative cysteine desulfurase [Methanocella arvoryzae MRE50]